MPHESAPNGDDRAGRLPDFVIIGAMRAGSTSLARYVGAHPGVSMPSRKEIHFFDWNWDKGVDWYRAHFREAPSGTIAGEATPIYIVYREAMERMAATCPDAKLLVILRDPTARAYSHYWYNRMLGFEPLEFPEALAAEAGRSTGTTDRRTFDYVARGRYLAQLKHVCDLYPRRALHVVLLEDLNRAPIDTYHSVCQFLGIDDTFVPPHLGEPLNRHASYRSKALAKASRGLPEPFRRAVRRLNHRQVGYPPMPAGARRRLGELFASDNAALASWLGRDLSVWTGGESREYPASSSRVE